MFELSILFPSILNGLTTGAVCGVDGASLQPQAGHFEVLHEAAGVKGLVGVGPAQGGHVPAHAFASGSQVERKVVFGVAGVVAKRLQRQPFQAGAFGHRQARALQCQFAGGPVKACGTRCGQQAVRAGSHGGGDVQRVAAHQAAGGVHHHVVADGVAFGVQTLQDAQRAVVLKARYGAGVAFAAVVQLQAGVPRHG